MRSTSSSLFVSSILMPLGGLLLLMATPLVFALLRSPVIVLLEIALALGILACTIVVHIVTLPTEFDASFKKALPVLEKYIPPEEMSGARSVLKAAAFTYVAGALVSMLNVARWLRILRFQKSASVNVSVSAPLPVRD